MMRQSYDSRRFANIPQLSSQDRSRFATNQFSWSQPVEQVNRTLSAGNTESSYSEPFFRLRHENAISPPQWLTRRHKQNISSSQSSSQDDAPTQNFDSTMKSLKDVVAEAWRLNSTESRELELLQKTVRQTSDRLQAKHTAVNRMKMANQQAIQKLIGSTKTIASAPEEESFQTDEDRSPIVSVQERRIALQELGGGVLQRLQKLSGIVKQMNEHSSVVDFTEFFEKIESELSEDNSSSIFGLH